VGAAELRLLDLRAPQLRDERLRDVGGIAAGEVGGGERLERVGRVRPRAARLAQAGQLREDERVGGRGLPSALQRGDRGLGTPEPLLDVREREPARGGGRAASRLRLGAQERADRSGSPGKSVNASRASAPAWSARPRPSSRRAEAAER
jgi:hypothetical protein